MSKYLCYDLRGIQSFIFQIPRLKYIVGGSALVDHFDRSVVKGLGKREGWELVSAAAGKGGFRVEDWGQANQIQDELVKEAHKMGIDIRFGRSTSYSDAARSTDRLFPYLPPPNDLLGHPCPESGLYPTKNNLRHDVVKRRLSRRRWFEDERLRGKLSLPESIGKYTFMHDVSEGTPGDKALGGRNRWAIICMDGNDMGSQFGEMTGRKLGGEGDERLLQWLQEMSGHLDQCSERACCAAIERVVREWAADSQIKAALTKKELNDEGVDEDDVDTDATVIPLRPLVVGGDDIVVLCHPSYATAFVEEACRVFEEESVRRAAEAPNDLELWPATGGRLTISAGILYCGVTMPLAAAIPYAENLLALAKSRGRQLKEPGAPAPACVDFETVTESLLDSPSTRRERELTFRDEDLENRQVKLTSRPYTLADFSRLLKEAKELKLPNTIVHQLLPGLRQAYSDRLAFYARLGKRHRELFDVLAEREQRSPSKASRWRFEGNCLSTDIIDMAILAEEDRRMTEESSREEGPTA